jgi:hypothetical protein
MPGLQRRRVLPAIPKCFTTSVLTITTALVFLHMSAFPWDPTFMKPVFHRTLLLLLLLLLEVVAKVARIAKIAKVAKIARIIKAAGKIAVSIKTKNATGSHS